MAIGRTQLEGEVDEGFRVDGRSDRFDHAAGVGRRVSASSDVGEEPCGLVHAVAAEKRDAFLPGELGVDAVGKPLFDVDRCVVAGIA